MPKSSLQPFLFFVNPIVKLIECVWIDVKDLKRGKEKTSTGEQKVPCSQRKKEEHNEPEQ